MDGNLQDKALLTNPANGMLQLVQMDEDNDGNYTITPDAKTNPEKFISPHGINMRMNLQSKKKVLTDEVKATWVTYREELRDFPESADPADPTWPTPPE